MGKSVRMSVVGWMNAFISMVGGKYVCKWANERVSE